MNCTKGAGGNGTSAEAMALTVGAVDYYIQHYIFPFQFCLGVLGNSINLCVLLSSGMKNQANTLLSAMAFADLAFLFCMLPHSLASFSLFYKSIRFAYFYIFTKIHWVALANCFSTAATFLVLAVSVERFSGVRHPMHTRFQLRDQRLLLLILAIFGLAFGLSLFHHLDYRLTIRVDQCARVHPRIQHVSELITSSPLLVRYVRIAKYAQSLLGVFLPVVAVTVLNVSLVYFLRKRQLLPRPSTSSSSGSAKAQQMHHQQQEFRRYSDFATFQRRERKVTATVIAIVSCFTVTHLPTLGPVIWEHFLTPQSELVTVSAILNSILVTGKVLNFFLFCSSSVYFRRRAVLILNAHLFHGRNRKKYSSMALSNIGTQTNVTSVNGAVSTNLQHGALSAALTPPKNCSSVFNSIVRHLRGQTPQNGAKTDQKQLVMNHHQQQQNNYTPHYHQQQQHSAPTYRVQKQSSVSLREALLRQSGAEFDDTMPTDEQNVRNGGRGSQSARQ